MNSINRVILNPLFALAFFGTPAVCGLVFLCSLWRWHEEGAAYFLIGSALYIVGTFVVTMVVNVPMNNALAAVNPARSEGAAVWTRDLANWTAWNHVRTIAALAAAGVLTFGIYLQARYVTPV